jgi:hypothetical protein
MAIHGYTILELAREKKINNRIEREVVKRVEKHNVISPYVSNCVKKGNLWSMEQNTAIFPLIDRFFGGCILTDIPNPDGDSVSGFFGMMAGNANITAQCSNDAYNGNNAKRGSYNTTESGAITGGYRHVFDWGTDRGNGTISSVGLCRPQIARADFSAVSTRIPENDAVINDILGDFYDTNTVHIDQAFHQMNIIDYEREKGFSLTYSSGTITVTEYELNTKTIHLIGAAYSIRSTTTHEISQTVNNYEDDWSTVTVAYTGSHLHLITINGNTLNDYAINTTDWTCTATTHTFTGVSFTTFRGSYIVMSGQGMLIKNGYLYALSGNQAQKIVKCNLSNDADITEFDNPVYTVAGNPNEWGNNGRQGSFMLMPNGDFYITTADANNYTPCVYCHNDHFYYCRRYMPTMQRMASGVNEYGTNVAISSYDLSRVVLETMFPWVSTVNNLDSAVTKSADLTMKLTYLITENAS